MYAEHYFEEEVLDEYDNDINGYNALNTKDINPISFDQMTRHNGQKEWENTIRLYKAIFAHPGDPNFNSGCKVICRSSDYNWNLSRSQIAKDTREPLQAIRDLYNSTDKQGFFLIIGWGMRVMPLLSGFNQMMRGVNKSKTKGRTGVIKSPRFF